MASNLQCVKRGGYKMGRSRKRKSTALNKAHRKALMYKTAGGKQGNSKYANKVKQRISKTIIDAAVKY
jgi:hypothetical protein